MPQAWLKNQNRTKTKTSAENIFCCLSKFPVPLSVQAEPCSWVLQLRVGSASEMGGRLSAGGGRVWGAHCPSPPPAVSMSPAASQRLPLQLQILQVPVTSLLCPSHPEDMSAFRGCKPCYATLKPSVFLTLSCLVNSSYKTVCLWF